MKIKKILIVPADVIVEKWPASPAAAFFIKAMKYAKRGMGGAASVYDSEIQRYSDIPKILGRDNVFVLGELYSHLHSTVISEYCPYPSCHGTPRGRSIKEEEVDDVIRDIDAVLISIGAGRSGELVTAKAKKRNIPVAIVDTRDHQSNYGATDIQKELCRGFEKGRDYDLYFKNDLPLGYKTDAILPLAPCPVRLESYTFPVSHKDISIFYSGRPRGECQKDRDETVALVRQFTGAFVLEHDSRNDFLTTREYWRNLLRSKLALSPSGKVWDSFRHCETGLAHGTAIIAPRPYVETVGPVMEDGENAILYDTELRDGKYHLKNRGEFAEKIKYYLESSENRERIAYRWAVDVKRGHTVFARSQYIVASMEAAF